LPDGLHAKKLQFWEDLGTGNLECFIWYVLWSFGIFYGHFGTLIFPLLVLLCQEKSGNPAFQRKVSSTDWFVGLLIALIKSFSEKSSNLGPMLKSRQSLNAMYIVAVSRVKCPKSKSPKQQSPKMASFMHLGFGLYGFGRVF
jgi:hypothetical protein